MSLLQLFSIIQARKWIAIWVFLLTVVIVSVVSFVLPKSYTATTTLVVNAKGADPVTGVMMPANLLPGYRATQVDVIKSRNVALKVVEKLGIDKSAQAKERFMQQTDGVGDIKLWYADKFLESLKVEPSRESNIIEISYTRPNDPAFAATMANAFSEAYLETNLELKTNPAKQATAFFNSQLKDLREDVEAAQAKLSAYQKEHQITYEVGRLDVEMTRLDQLSSQLVAAQAQTYDSASRNKQLRKSGASLSPEILANPLIQNLKSQLIQAKAKLSDVSDRLGVNHPIYQSANQEVESLKKSIAAEVSKSSVGVGQTAKVSKLREDEIKDALKAQKERVLKLKSEQDEMSVLLREVDSAQKIYDNALLRFGQTSIESESVQTDISILNPATEPQKHSWPKRKLNLILSVILGSVLGLFFAILFELLDRKVRSVDDLNSNLGVPVLIDFSKPKKSIIERLKALFSKENSVPKTNFTVS